MARKATLMAQKHHNGASKIWFSAAASRHPRSPFHSKPSILFVRSQGSPPLGPGLHFHLWQSPLRNEQC